MFKINVNSLKIDPEEFSSDLPYKAFDLGQDAQLLQDVLVQFQVHRMNDKVFIRGNVSAQVNLKCVRCLNDFTKDVRTDLFLLAMPKIPRDLSSGAEREIQPDDPAIIQYAGERIDLQPEIQGALLLALPMKPLCQDDCPGLCANCGQRLLEKSCGCHQDHPPGPFSALKGLK